MGYRRRARTITLKFAAKCRDCGAVLEVGSTARWYGRGRVYGTTCHEDRRAVQHADDFPPTNVQLPEGADEEGAQLENRLSDDEDAIRYNVEVPGLGVEMKTGPSDENGPIPQTKLFD